MSRRSLHGQWWVAFGDVSRLNLGKKVNPQTLQKFTFIANTNCHFCQFQMVVYQQTVTGTSNISSGTYVEGSWTSICYYSFGSGVSIHIGTCNFIFESSAGGSWSVVAN